MLRGFRLSFLGLPLVESSFDYTARSSVGASGIWQFMKSTGKLYMTVNSRVDERLDPLIASRSASRYLANAHKRLKTWPLAVTSYNHGVGGMARAVKQVGSRDLAKIIKKYQGKTFGFASQNFYASFLAACDVYENRSKYFPGLKLDEPVFFDEIILSKNISYSRLRKRTGLSDKEFRKLNPAILKRVRSGRSTVPKGYAAKVSAGGGKHLVKALGGGSACVGS